MSIRFDDVGNRLKAFRLASGLRPEEIAARVGISRAALYRYERGDVSKIETLERFAEVFDVSVPTLLGVGVEYVASAVAFFERMRQLEAEARDIVVFFGPISYLLTSEAYDDTLKTMLIESIPSGIGDRARAEADIATIMTILRARKAAFRTHMPRVRTLMGITELVRLLREGLVGDTELDESERRRRRGLAGDELAHIARLLEEPDRGTEAGIVVDTAPGTSFQLFRGVDRTTLAVSPYRLGAHPNVRIGVALLTTAPDAIRLHDQVATDLWDRALKGRPAAELVRELIRRHGPNE